MLINLAEIAISQKNGRSIGSNATMQRRVFNSVIGSSTLATLLRCSKSVTIWLDDCVLAYLGLNVAEKSVKPKLLPTHGFKIVALYGSLPSIHQGISYAATASSIG